MLTEGVDPSRGIWQSWQDLRGSSATHWYPEDMKVVAFVFNKVLPQLLLDALEMQIEACIHSAGSEGNSELGRSGVLQIVHGLLSSSSGKAAVPSPEIMTSRASQRRPISSRHMKGSCTARNTSAMNVGKRLQGRKAHPDHTAGQSAHTSLPAPKRQLLDLVMWS